MDFQDFSMTLNQISKTKLKSQYKHEALRKYCVLRAYAGLYFERLSLKKTSSFQTRHQWTCDFNKFPWLFQNLWFYFFPWLFQAWKWPFKKFHDFSRLSMTVRTLTLPGWAPVASLGCGSAPLPAPSPPPRWRQRSSGRSGEGYLLLPAPRAWGEERERERERVGISACCYKSLSGSRPWPMRTTTWLPQTSDVTAAMFSTFTGSLHPFINGNFRPLPVSVTCGTNQQTRGHSSCRLRKPCLFRFLPFFPCESFFSLLFGSFFLIRCELLGQGCLCVQIVKPSEAHL